MAATASGMAKLQLLLELKNKLSGGLNQAKKQIEKSVGGLGGKIQQLQMKHSQAFDAMADKAPGLGNALKLLTNPYALAATGVAAIGAAFVACTKKALEWQNVMAELNGTAQLDKQGLKELSDQLIDIGMNSSVALMDVPKAFNVLNSALDDVDLALKTLPSTLKASKAGFMDVTTTANAITSFMGASGIKDAGRAWDYLFAVQKTGKAEMTDIANQLPKVIPIAKNVGISIGETAGAFSFLTKSLRPEQVATAVGGIMDALGNTNVLKNLKKNGINVFDGEGNMRNLTDILELMQNKISSFKSDAQRINFMDSLGLDKMANLGFSSLLVDLEATKAVIADVVDSAGALEDAFEATRQPMDSWKEIGNKITGTMIKIGRTSLPILSAIGEKILKVIEFFTDLYKNGVLLRGIFWAIGKIITWAFKIAITPVVEFINILKFLWSVLGWVWARFKEFGNWIDTSFFQGVLGISDGFKGMIDAVKPHFIWLKDMLYSILRMTYNILTFDIKGIKKHLEQGLVPDVVKMENMLQKKISPTLHVPKSDFEGTGTDPDPDPDPTADAIKSIGSGAQTKNITINIGSFIDKMNPQNAEINSMNKREFEKWLNEMFLRVVRGAETAI